VLRRETGPQQILGCFEIALRFQNSPIQNGSYHALILFLKSTRLGTPPPFDNDSSPCYYTDHHQVCGIIHEEFVMEEETVVTSSMDAETVEILMDDRVATGG
jgi:hypothetical protein